MTDFLNCKGIVRCRIKRMVLCLCFIISVLCVQGQTVNDTAIRYVHTQTSGLMSCIIKTAARLFLPKNSIPRKLSNDNFTSAPAAIPKTVATDLFIDTLRVHGRNVFTLAPKGTKSAKVVLFLHGGAYINNIFRQHWSFAAKIIRETNCTFIIPDYPLAPANTFQEAFAMLETLYKQLLGTANEKDIVLMGDSAGGGFALALAMKLRDGGTALPAAVILLSPWLDISMTNPQIKEVQKKDVSLRAENLVLAAKAWAGNTETNHYLLSPVYGSLEGLPKISIFIGTHDILEPDCRKLKSLMEQKNIAMNYFEYPKMFHDWMMLGPLRESKLARAQICSLILDKKQ